MSKTKQTFSLFDELDQEKLNPHDGNFAVCFINRKSLIIYQQGSKLGAARLESYGISFDETEHKNHY